MTLTAVYKRAPMYPKQEEALFTDARYGVVEASTKSGKTVGCLVWLDEQAVLRGGRNRNFWWIAPTFSVTRIAYRRLKYMLPDQGYEFNETHMTITYPNGSVVWFKSGEKPDSLYGEDVYAAVIDEATRVKEESWWAIRSTLTATEGPVRIIGNVKGRRNWAYRLARRAEEGHPNYHYARLTVYDAVEAGIFSGEEAEDARQVLPAAVFRELYLAEAAEDGEAFFQIGRISYVSDLPAGLRVARAWDLAATEPNDRNPEPDYTVGVKLGFDSRRIFVLDVVRFRGAPDTVIDKVTSTAITDGRVCNQVFEEEMGAAGKTLIEQFRRALKPHPAAGRVYPSPVTGGKVARAFHFAAAVNDNRVSMLEAPWNDLLLDELDGFPEGETDDQVDAAAHCYNHLVPRGGERRIRWVG